MSLTDYSSLEQEIKDAPEPEILPDNTEAKLRIVKVTSGCVDDESKNTYGAGYYQVLFDVPGEFCPMFQEFFWDLNDRDKIPPDQYQRALPKFRKFAATFNIDYSRPFDWETDLENLEGWAILKVVKDKKNEYPPKNGIKEFIVPK